MRAPWEYCRRCGGSLRIWDITMTISPNVVAAHVDLAATLQSASKAVKRVRAPHTEASQANLTTASTAIHQVLTAIRELAPSETMFSPAVGRYARHSEIALTQALGGSHLALARAKESVRLALMHATISLDVPRIRHKELDTVRASGATDPAAIDRGPGWVDGQFLDSLGNPARGGGAHYTGPDGQGFDWSGEPSRYAGSSDQLHGGDYFSGI